MAEKQAGPSAADLRIGQRLRDLRLSHSLTQSELVRGRYSAAYVSAVERGKVVPTLKLLRVCAERLEVPLSDLLDEPNLDHMQSQRARQTLAQMAYAEIQAVMLLGAHDVSAAHTRLAELREQQGASASSMLLWSSAYAALISGDIAQATALAEEYRRRADPTGDRRVRASWHWFDGLIHSARKEPREAIAAYRQAIALQDEALVDPDFPIYVLWELADAHLRVREVNEAYHVVGQALDAYERFIDPLRQADQSARLAQIAYEAGQYTTAYLLIRWAWTWQRVVFVHRAAGRMYLRHALLSAHAAPEADQERDLRDLRRALALAKEVGDGALRILAAAFLVVRLILKGRSDEASRLADDEQLLAEGAAPLGLRERAARALALGWLAQVRDARDEAHARVNEARTALAELSEPSADLAYDWETLSELFAALGDTDAALWALRQADMLLRLPIPQS